MTEQPTATEVAPNEEQAPPVDAPVVDTAEATAWTEAEMNYLMNRLLLLSARECASVCFAAGREAVAAAVHAFAPVQNDDQIEGVEPLTVMAVLITGGNAELIDQVRTLIEESTGTTLMPVEDTEQESPTPEEGSDPQPDCATDVTTPA